MHKLLKLLKALSNKKRLQIIKLLKRKSLNTSEIAKEINLSYRSTAKHLQKLQNAGFVFGERQGIYSFYTVNKKQKSQLIHLIKTF